MKAALVKCNCKNKFQDREYGSNTRVANHCGNSPKDHPTFRCTVCDKEHKN